MIVQIQDVEQCGLWWGSSGASQRIAQDFKRQFVPTVMLVRCRFIDLMSFKTREETYESAVTVFWCSVQWVTVDQTHALRSYRFYSAVRCHGGGVWNIALCKSAQNLRRGGRISFSQTLSSLSMIVVLVVVPNCCINLALWIFNGTIWK